MRSTTRTRTARTGTTGRTSPATARSSGRWLLPDPRPGRRCDQGRRPRLGTKEIESAAIKVEEVAEAAAVPVIDELRGKIVEIYVALKPGFQPSEEIEREAAGNPS